MCTECSVAAESALKPRPYCAPTLWLHDFLLFDFAIISHHLSSDTSFKAANASFQHESTQIIGALW